MACQPSTAPECGKVFREGDLAEIEIAERGVITNIGSGAKRVGEPVPPQLLEVMLGGGMLASMEAKGLISEAWETEAKR